MCSDHNFTIVCIYTLWMNLLDALALVSLDVHWYCWGNFLSVLTIILPYFVCLYIVKDIFDE